MGADFTRELIKYNHGTHKTKIQKQNSASFPSFLLTPLTILDD